MTAKEALIEYMKANGYDGLAGEECGCHLDNLVPCGEMGVCLTDCELGHTAPCPRDGNCECDPEDKDATHIMPGRKPDADYLRRQIPAMKPHPIVTLAMMKDGFCESCGDDIPAGCVAVRDPGGFILCVECGQAEEKREA